MNWIIENLVKEDSFTALAKAVDESGQRLQRINGDYAYRDVAHFINSPLIFNGSIEMCKLVGPQLRNANNFPVLYCTWQNYLCTNYYPSLSDFLFNDDYVMVPLSEIKKRKFFFFGLFGKEGVVFIRPNDGDKSFKGGMIDLEEFDKWYDPALGSELAIISSPKNILGEWRFVCSKNKEIIACSSYRFQGDIIRVPSAPVGATKKCKEILETGFAPDSVFCVDIVEDNDGNFWLMEPNSFSSAGLYACNKKAIVERVSEIAQADFDEFKKNLSLW